MVSWKSESTVWHFCFAIFLFDCFVLFFLFFIGGGWGFVLAFFFFVVIEYNEIWFSGLGIFICFCLKFQSPKLLLFLFYSLRVLSHQCGCSLESEWHQVSSGLQDSSQYLGRSQQGCSLDYHDSSSDFQLFQSLFLTIEHRSKHNKLQSVSCSTKRQNPQDDKFFFAFLGDPFVSQNPREFYASYFLERIRFLFLQFSSMVKTQSFARFPFLPSRA